MPEPTAETLPPNPNSTAALEIQGVRYFSTEHAAQVAGVTRQTLWRWRRDGKVPGGCRYRDQQVVFTGDEVARICAYAQRLEPTPLAASPDETNPKDPRDLKDLDA